MRLRNRPLLVDGVDKEVYVPRPDLERSLVRALEAGRNTLVIGASGSGKTTLLRKAGADLRARGSVVAWVDASAASDALELLELAEVALSDSGVTRGVTRFTDDDANRTWAVRLIAAVDRLPASTPAVILVDGALGDSVAFDVFGRARDRLWRLPHTWALATTPERSGSVRAAPASEFWSARVDVPEMESDEIEALLMNGLTPDELERLRQYGTWPLRDTPRRVVQFAQQVIDGVRPDDTAMRDARISRLMRPEQMALSELEALGRPASARDEELLARLGWQRPYAARILARLEDAGLARSFPGPREGQGRPMKLYEPVEGI